MPTKSAACRRAVGISEAATSCEFCNGGDGAQTAASHRLHTIESPCMSFVCAVATILVARSPRVNGQIRARALSATECTPTARVTRARARARDLGLILCVRDFRRACDAQSTSRKRQKKKRAPNLCSCASDATPLVIIAADLTRRRCEKYYFMFRGAERTQTISENQDRWLGVASARRRGRKHAQKIVHRRKAAANKKGEQIWEAREPVISGYRFEFAR